MKKMVDPNELARLHGNVPRNKGTWQHIAHYVGAFWEHTLGNPPKSDQEIEHTPPYKVRRIGNRILAIAGLSVTIGGSTGFAWWLNSDGYKGLKTVCAISPDKKEYKPAFGTNWDPAVTQVSGANESLLCIAVVNNQLSTEYGKPSYGETYLIPKEAHEIKVSVSSADQVEVTTIPGTTLQS